MMIFRKWIVENFSKDFTEEDFRRLCESIFRRWLGEISCLEIWETLHDVCCHEFWPVFACLADKKATFVDVLWRTFRVAFYDSLDDKTLKYVYDKYNCKTILERYGVTVATSFFLERIVDIFYERCSLRNSLYEKCKEFLCDKLSLIDVKKFDVQYNKCVEEMYLILFF